MDCMKESQTVTWKLKYKSDLWTVACWSPGLEADNQSDLWLLPYKPFQEHLLLRSAKKDNYKSNWNMFQADLFFTVKLLIAI